MSQSPSPLQLLSQAMDQLFGRIRECDYVPEFYLQVVREHGVLGACKHIVGGILSDDSLQLWARGRPELTIEALILDVRWSELFSDEEKRIATSRVGDMRVSPTNVDAETATLLTEDDIVWGEELIAGEDVCRKLSEIDQSLCSNGVLPSNWVLGYLRQHVRDCRACAGEHVEFTRALAEFDHEQLRTIGELLSRCVICDEESVNFDGGGDNDRRIDFERSTFVFGMRMLQARDCQIAARLGSIMRGYEHSHGVPSFFGLQMDNPWLNWRASGGINDAAKFVCGLSQHELFLLLRSRHLSYAGLAPQLWPLKLPSDNKMPGITGVLDILEKQDLEDWEEILAQNYTQRSLALTIDSESASVLSAEHKQVSDSIWARVNWSQLLYLATCAALPETYPMPRNDASESLLKSFNELKNQVDSLAASQIPLTSKLERLIEQLPRLRRQQFEASLKEILGARVYDQLCHDAMSSLLSAEVLLHDPEFPSPSLGVLALCNAFEVQLKKILLGKFGGFIGPAIKEFPCKSDRLRHPLIRYGKPNDRLTMGELQAGLDQAEPEFSKFCAGARIDGVRVKSTIKKVLDYRNPAAHGSDMSFEKARRIREELLGMISPGSGMFSVLLGEDSRRGLV